MWVTVDPGPPQTLRFSQGPLTYVIVEFPEGSVSQTTTLHISIPSTTDPVFYRSGLELITPVISLEPLNVRFEKEVRLKLQWLSDPLEEKEMRSLYGFRSLTVEAIGEGQWTTTAVIEAVSGVHVILSLRGGGVYFSAYPKAVSDSPPTIVGDPCADAGMDAVSCSASVSCQVFGCNAQWCGAGAPQGSFLCLPDAFSRARKNCLCACYTQKCLWIR